MIITILGSGTSIPLRSRAGPGWVVTLDGEAADAVLVDPSAGSIGRMADRGIPLDRLTHVLFSHFHPDHTGDLVPILFALRNPRYGIRSPLCLIGPRGLVSLLDRLYGVYGKWILSRREVRVVELGTDPADRDVSIGPLDVTAFPVVHADPSVAYRFSMRGGPCFTYTGDTDRCDGAVEAARGAELLLCECSFPEGDKHPGHLVPSEAGMIAAAAGAGNIVLLHLYPECSGHDLVGPCRRFFQRGTITVAEDGMTFRLPPQ